MVPRRGADGESGLLADLAIRRDCVRAL